MTATITFLNTGKIQVVEITGIEYLPHVIILDLDGGFYSFRPDDNVKIEIRRN